MKRDALQLLVVAALFTAAKFEELHGGDLHWVLVGRHCPCSFASCSGLPHATVYILYIYMCTHAYVCMYSDIYTYVYIYICVYSFICLFIHLFIYYTRKQIRKLCIYIYICTHTNSNIHDNDKMKVI